MPENTSKPINEQKNPGNVRSVKRPIFIEQELMDTLNSNNIYTRSQLDTNRFNKFSRFGFFDPYNANSSYKEYLFFTKMDLNLFNTDDMTLNPQLKNNVFFTEALLNHRDTMLQMQLSADTNNPFCNLLSNSVVSDLDLQDINLDTLETASNIAGTKLEYPFATTTSSNIFEFTLEFEDTQNLDVYMFFRIWYEYELLKADGLVSPPRVDDDGISFYTKNRILHDVMSCYKIIVSEDYQTIVHYSKMWGVYPTVVPRGAFSTVDNTIKFSVSFKAQWVEDMDPSILSDLNKVAVPLLNTHKKDIPIFGKAYYPDKQIKFATDMVTGNWCSTPHIVTSTLHNRRVYKLKWR